MEPLPVNSEPPAAPADAYIWEPPGKPVTIQLQIGVVDGLSIEVMRGFGAVPKRGAEVGGLLLGTIYEDSTRRVVHIADFEALPIEYARGPSFLLSLNDRAQLREALNREASDRNPPLSVVGFYRSHTREGLALTDEDIRVLEEYFPDPSQIVLLIKPFATKVSLAGFLFRQDGEFASREPLEQFPFRRRELSGSSIPPPAPLPSPEPEVMRVTKLPAQVQEDPELTEALINMPEEPEDGVSQFDVFRERTAPSQTVAPNRWFAASVLTAVVLAVLAAGCYLALNWRGQFPFSSQNPYHLSLSASSAPEGFSVRWDSDAPPIRSARKGILWIEDGKSAQRVDLTPAQLRSGAVLYREHSDSIAFRLELSLSDHTTLTEEIAVGTPQTAGRPRQDRRSE